MTDLDNILDGTLDDLADLPTNAPFPAGAHLVTMFLSFPKKPDPKKPLVVCKFEYVSPLEMADATIDPPNAGDESTLFFNMKTKEGEANEFGQGQLKLCLQALTDLGVPGDTPREKIQNAKAGVQVAIVNSTSEYKGNKQMQLQKVMAP